MSPSRPSLRRPQLRPRRRALPCGLAALCLPASVLAGPWIAPGDNELRHHVEVLADAGVLSTPITTWPMSWAQVATDLGSARPERLDEEAQESYSALRAAMDRADETGFSLSSRVTHAGADAALRDFGSVYREEAELAAALSWMGRRTAVRLQANGVEDPIDGEEVRADGSYLAQQWGNWIASLGMVDRWWGPGWQSSLILSSNARPVPAASVQRLRTTAPEWFWLSWLGPWQLSGFFGQMDDQQSVPNHYLLGARLDLRPLKVLEIGFSRTAQWGGDGRPQDLGSLGRLLAGIDNQEDLDSQPGNQLAGIDWRLNLPWLPGRNAFYGQLVGEDVKNYLPYQWLLQYGLESSFAAFGWQHRLALEWSDTTADSAMWARGGGYNTAYENIIYRSGYRRFGRPMGASVDNDSTMLGLSGYHVPRREQMISWTVASLQLDRDGTDLPAPGGSRLGPPMDTLYAQLSYSFPMFQTWTVRVGGEYYADPIVLRESGEPIDSSVYVSLQRGF